MAWVEIMLPSARTLPTGKLTQNPIRTGERRCILYVGDDSGITLAPCWSRCCTPVNRSSRPYFRRRRQTDALTNYQVTFTVRDQPVDPVRSESLRAASAT